MDEIIRSLKENDEEAVKYVVERLMPLKRIHLRFLEEPYKGELDGELDYVIYKTILYYEGKSWNGLKKYVNAALKNRRIDFVKLLNNRGDRSQIKVHDLKSSIDCYPIENLLKRVNERIKSNRKNVNRVYKALLSANNISELIVENEEKKMMFALSGRSVKMLQKHIQRETRLTKPTVLRCIRKIMKIIKEVSMEAEYEFN